MDRKKESGGSSSSPSIGAKRHRGKRISSGVKKFVTGQLAKLANEQQINSPDQPSGSGQSSAGPMGQLVGSFLIGQGGDKVGSLVGQLGSTSVGHPDSQEGQQQGGSLAGQLGRSLVGHLGDQEGQQQGGSLAGQLGSSLVGHLGGQEGQQQGGSLVGQLGGSLARKLGKKKKKLVGQIGGSLIGQLGEQGNPGGVLANQLGESLLGQLGGGGQQGGSLAGQLGGSLLGQLGGGGGQEGGALLGQLGGLAGGVGGPKPLAAGGAQLGAPAGTNPVLSTVACSAVQGLRRAAEAKSIPVKVFWYLMVLVSVGMFVQGAIDLTQKVRTVQIVRTYQMDKVPFVFPDLYFCPKNSYSGSFPYTLNQSQADVVNREVERLSKLYDEQYAASGFDASSKTKVWSIQQSLPAHLLRDYILHRPKQSLFYTPMISYYGDVGYETVLLPMSIMCFKVVMSNEDRKVLIRRQNQESLRLALFTDPTFPDFKYSGELIKPIFNPNTNESIPFRVWYPSGIMRTVASGYTMLVVPTGHYPSMEYESKFLLAPGKSYDIDIHMEEHKYSQELWNSHCSPQQKTVEFVDHLTGKKVEYNSSYDSCYYTEFSKHLHKIGGYIQQGFPVSWDLRESPRWGNLTENNRINRSTMEYGMDLTKADEVGNPVSVCNSQQECVQQKYVTSFSFHNWPSIGGSYSAAFGQPDKEEQPAIYQLATIAKQLDAGNHSTHSEAAMRHFISESMLEVSIRTDKPLAARVLMTASYSSTSFMSDIGGLMGLYLGCSVLTLCEFAEMLYAKAAKTVKTKCRGRPSNSSADSDNGHGVEADDENNEQDAAGDVAGHGFSKPSGDEAELTPLKVGDCGAVDDSTEAVV